MDTSYHTPQPRRKRQVPQAKTGYKYCPDCEQELLLDAFSLHKGKPYVYCRDCARERDRARRHPYQQENKRPNPRRKVLFHPTKEGHRVCHVCEQEKPFEAFHQRRGKPIATCIECVRAQDRERNAMRRTRKYPVVPQSTKPDHKVCNTCFAEKPCADFRQDQQKGDGYIGRCKQCEQERWDTLSEEEKEQYRLQDRMSREPRRDLIQERDRERSKRRQEETPLVILEYHHRRNARKKEVQVEDVNFQRIIERDGYSCYICNGSIDPTIKKGPAMLSFDHVIPLQPRLGEPQGTHSEENIRPAHKSCNSRKRNKPFETLNEWDRRGIG